MTLGVPYPMFLEHTCKCNGTLCPHVVFTFNTSVRGEADYDWTTKRTGNGHQVEYNFPTFQDAWRLTNIAAQQRMANTSQDSNLTVAGGGATALQLHIGSVCQSPGSHDPTLCRENGLDDGYDCCAPPGKGSCADSDSKDHVTVFSIPGTSVFGPCDDAGVGQWTCCMRTRGQVNNDQHRQHGVRNGEINSTMSPSPSSSISSISPSPSSDLTQVSDANSHNQIQGQSNQTEKCGLTPTSKSTCTNRSTWIRWHGSPGKLPVGTVPDSFQHYNKFQNFISPWDSVPHCTQDRASKQLKSSLKLPNFAFDDSSRKKANEDERGHWVEELRSSESKRNDLSLSLASKLVPVIDGDLKLPCSQQNGETSTWKMVIFPIDGHARRSLYDNACWTENDLRLPGAEDKTPPRDRIPETGMYESSNTTLGQFTVFGCILFLSILTVIIALQDCIINFTPEDHPLAQEASCKMKLKKGPCGRLANKYCGKSKRKALYEDTLASLGYYALVGLPYSSFMNAFLQPGPAMGTFNPVQSEDNSTSVQAQRLLAPDYYGAAMFRPAMVGFDSLMALLFVAGVGWPILLPSFCMWCPREESKGKPKNCFAYVFVCVYLGAILFLGGLMVATTFQKDINWNLSAIIFSVNLDWSTLRLRVPNSLGFPAVTSFILSFCRLAALITNYALSFIKMAAKSANSVAKASAAAAREAAEDISKVKIAPGVAEDTTNTLSSASSEAEVNVSEQLSEIAKEKVQGKVQEKAIKKADSAANNLLTDSQIKSVAEWKPVN